MNANNNLPTDWRDQLAAKLGARPRRIGPWAEMALYGALQCLASHGLARLSPHAVLRVSSAFGPVEALASVGAACEDGLLPMPFDFLQSQPSQMLAAVSQHLQWQGDGIFVALDDWSALTVRAAQEAAFLRRRAEAAGLPWVGLLLGRVDVTPSACSDWQWFT